MIRFTEVFRDRFGVETICVTLGATEGVFVTAWATALLGGGQYQLVGTGTSYSSVKPNGFMK